MTLIAQAKYYAIKCHEGTNHKYDGKSYETHLQIVVDTAWLFAHLLPQDKVEDVIAACWLHDVIEDCRQTYNDVKNNIGTDVAEIVYALTNEKGKNRSERANGKYYDGIRNTPFALFVKLCDRIANWEYSKSVGSNMADMYEKENVRFIRYLWQSDTPYTELFDHLQSLRTSKKPQN